MEENQRSQVCDLRLIQSRGRPSLRPVCSLERGLQLEPPWNPFRPSPPPRGPRRSALGESLNQNHITTSTVHGGPARPGLFVRRRSPIPSSRAAWILPEDAAQLALHVVTSTAADALSALSAADVVRRAAHTFPVTTTASAESVRSVRVPCRVARSRVLTGYNPRQSGDVLHAKCGQLQQLESIIAVGWGVAYP